MKSHYTIPNLTETQVRCFWALVDKRGPNDCWPWLGGVTKAKHSQDYGIWHIDNSTMNLRPHRVAYTLLVGPIVWPLTLDHVAGRCYTTLCVNPAHLEPVTQGDNVRRYYLNRTHCKRGHKIEQHGKPCGPCKTIGKRRERARKLGRPELAIPEYYFERFGHPIGSEFNPIDSTYQKGQP